MSLSKPDHFYDVPMDLSAERQILGILIKHPGQVDRVLPVALFGPGQSPYL